MPSQAVKSLMRLNDRRKGYDEAVRLGQKGYHKPGSLSRHKSMPLGRTKTKKR